jgi:hypothetical protein
MGVSARRSSQERARSHWALGLRNLRNRPKKFWAGSSSGHYPFPPIRPARTLLAPGSWILAPGSLLITDSLITDY